MPVSRHIFSQGKLTYHLVDSLHNCQHLLVADLAVAVDIVELERPIKLIFHLSSTCDTEGADELLKVDCTGLIRVEDIEHIICKRRRIPEREELFVDLLELLLSEHAGWAVLQETCIASAVAQLDLETTHTLVPLLQLLLVKVGSLLEVGQLLL